MKLDKPYINEATRIRKEYITSLKMILTEENSIKENKSEVDTLQNNMETIIEEDMNDITKRLKLNNNLIKIEKIIKKIQDRIKPHYDNIERLRKDADKLYNSITEKYPNLSEKEIETQIAPYLQFK